jgi:hypothetical protein
MLEGLPGPAEVRKSCRNTKLIAACNALVSSLIRTGS